MLRFRGIATLGLGIAFAVMVVVALLGYGTIDRLVATARGVEHTRQVIEAFDQITLNTTSAGRARRIYSFTGDDANLARIAAAEAAAREALARAHTLTLDNPAQGVRLERLAPMLERRFAEIDAAVDIQKRSGADPAREEAYARSGSEQLGHIAELVDEGVAAERDLLVARQARADRSAAFAKQVDLAGTAASAVIIVIALASLRRENAQRRKSELATDRANRFLDSIVEHIPDMLFVKEARELRFERINRAGEALLGLSRDELLGKNDHDFFSKEQAAFFEAKDRQTLAAGDVIDIAEEPIDTKEGRRWLHTKKVPILDEKGAPAFLLGISEDITERKRTAEALRAAIESAEAANRELEAFSYSVAHDLRAPLRSMDGFSVALIEDCGENLSEDGRRHLDRIRAASQRMSQLIDGLLALSRVARAELKFESVDLSALAGAAVEELQQSTARGDVQVRIEPAMRVRGDPRLLRVVLDNLLGNAFKFTGTRERPSIEFGVQDQGNARVYFVRDNGVGFDRKYADKLFGVFQRLHDAGQFPGTGIGLATVHRIIARHGGTIWAQAETDRGATFYFTLSADLPVKAAAE